MMMSIEPLGLDAGQWQFLRDSRVEQYVKTSDRKLVPESTRRQFLTARDILARLDGSQGEERRRGVLLADDAGLGKTTVAALVAWVVALAGTKRRVRILAPNDVMARRWKEELVSHVVPLRKCAAHLEANEKHVKGKATKLSPGSIQVVTHFYASQGGTLGCDLLIIDEAHRARGESTFSEKLEKQKKSALRVLILTATPFSISPKELERMLMLIGADEAWSPVRVYSRALDDLYTGDATRDCNAVAKKLGTKAVKAVDALKRFVIRHGIDDLPREQTAFGGRVDWPIEVPCAQADELGLMLRMDRALRLLKDDNRGSAKATNDARFHVGWRHLGDVVKKVLENGVKDLPAPANDVLENHLRSIRRLRAKMKVHPKMAKVGEEVARIVGEGQKVMLFCHHHATAQELTVHLDCVTPKLSPPGLPLSSVWKSAWDRALAEPEDQPAHLRKIFIDWLSSDLIRAQTWQWLPNAPLTETKLVDALRTMKARKAGRETVADAAQRLLDTLLQSASSKGLLVAARENPGLLPGANGRSRVLGVCDPGEVGGEAPLFQHGSQPDTVIAMFNSPFGPDVLVATDRLSEGIDLHRYCRHLIHYELDASPIRTIQRNGRIRRVDCWASVSGKPARYAYPAFGGTRDLRLVQIMQKRIKSFSLLLGGVPEIDMEDASSEEEWRNKVICLATKDLKESGGDLRAREPGGDRL